MQPVEKSGVLMLWLIMVITSIVVILVNKYFERYFFNKMKNDI